MCSETLHCCNFCDLAFTLPWASDSQFKKRVTKGFEVRVRVLCIRVKLGKCIFFLQLSLYMELRDVVCADTKASSCFSKD